MMIYDEEYRKIIRDDFKRTIKIQKEEQKPQEQTCQYELYYEEILKIKLKAQEMLTNFKLLALQKVQMIINHQGQLKMIKLEKLD